jgi:hypothetical protein
LLKNSPTTFTLGKTVQANQFIKESSAKRGKLCFLLPQPHEENQKQPEWTFDYLENELMRKKQEQ